MIYVIYLYDHKEGLLESTSQIKACERACELTREDYNEVNAEPLKLPQGVTLEEYCRVNQVSFLEE